MYVSKKNNFFFLGKKFETMQNSNILKSKITRIKYKSPNKKKAMELKSPFKVHLSTSCNKNKNKNNNFKTNFLRGKSFIESNLIEQNLHMTKRINQKLSVYSLSQWKKDFKKSRIYKKISCEYPSINFIGKRKKQLKCNFPINLKGEYNIFNGIKFRPFASFENEKNKNTNHDNINSFSKKNKKTIFFQSKKNLVENDLVKPIKKI